MIVGLSVAAAGRGRPRNTRLPALATFCGPRSIARAGRRAGGAGIAAAPATIAGRSATCEPFPGLLASDTTVHPMTATDPSASSAARII